MCTIPTSMKEDLLEIKNLETELIYCGQKQDELFMFLRDGVIESITCVDSTELQDSTNSEDQTFQIIIDDRSSKKAATDFPFEDLLDRDNLYFVILVDGFEGGILELNATNVSLINVGSLQISEARQNQAELLPMIQFYLNQNELKARKANVYKNDFQQLKETNDHLILATFRERDLRKKLQEALDELDRVTKKLAKQNIEITDSITYSKKIQTAIIASTEQIKEEFPDSGLLFRPRDIVSGDFPWIYSNDKYVYVAAVDCTGHGVPGALLSMIGSLLLTDICNSHEEQEPAIILTILNEALAKIFNADGENGILGGMDLALVRVDKKQKRVHFSGAFRPLYWLNAEKELTQVKASRRSIGSHYYNSNKEFETIELETQEGDSLFFFSDGISDQLSVEDSKFGRKRIEALINANANENCEIICETLGKELNIWHEGTKQLDDMLFIAVRL